MKKGLFLLIVIGILGMAACNDDDCDNCIESNNLSLKINATIDGGKNVELGNYYLNPNGDSVRFDIIKFYLSDIELVKDNGDIVSVSDIMYYDFADHVAQEFLIDNGTYQEIRFGIGVSSDLNGQDPATYETEHPLSVENNMYWSWATMYRFFVTEGVFSTCFIDGTNDPQAFAYHSGTDTLYREVELPKIFSTTENAVTPVELNINLDTVFETLNMCQENSSHTMGSTEAFQIVYKITQGLKDAFE